MPGPSYHGRTHSAGGTDPIPGLGSGGGIAFETDPQSGGWLLVDTTSTLPSGTGAGYGIVFRPSDGFFVYTASTIAMFGGSVGFTSTGNIAMTATSVGAKIAMTSTRITLDGGQGHVDMTNTNMQVQQYTGPIKVTVASGSVLTVYESDGTTKAFEVRDDGSVHIKTGGSVVADL